MSLLNVLSQFAYTPDFLTTERIQQALTVITGHTKPHQHWWPCLSSFKPCVSLAQVTCSWQGDQTWTLVLTVLMQNATFWAWNVVAFPCRWWEGGDAGDLSPTFKSPILEETYIVSTPIPLVTWRHSCREPAYLWWEEDGNWPTLLASKGPSECLMPPRRSLGKFCRF